MSPALNSGAGAGPYILALSCTDPDEEHPSLAALARAVVDRRDRLHPGVDLVFTRARLTRGELPGGAAVTVRLDDGSSPARGPFFAYVLVPSAQRGAYENAVADAVAAAAFAKAHEARRTAA